MHGKRQNFAAGSTADKIRESVAFSENSSEKYTGAHEVSPSRIMPVRQATPIK